MRRVLAVTANRGGLGAPSVYGGWRPLSTEVGGPGDASAPPQGAGRGRGVPLASATPGDGPAVGAGRGQAVGSLFSRILDKGPPSAPRERPEQPVLTKAQLSEPRVHRNLRVTDGAETGGPKVYRVSRADSERFSSAKSEADGSSGTQSRGGEESSMRRMSRARLEAETMDFGRSKRTPGQAQVSRTGGQQRRAGPVRAVEPVYNEEPSADYFETPIEWKVFAKLGTDENLSLDFFDSRPMTWEEARAARTARQAVPAEKTLEAFFPALKDLFDVDDEMLIQLSKVAADRHAREQAVHPSEGLDVKEQEAVLRTMLTELKGANADPRTARSAEKLLNTLEHNQHMSFQDKKRMVERFASVATF